MLATTIVGVLLLLLIIYHLTREPSKSKVVPLHRPSPQVPASNPWEWGCCTSPCVSAPCPKKCREYFPFTMAHFRHTHFPLHASPEQIKNHIDEAGLHPY